MRPSSIPTRPVLVKLANHWQDSRAQATKTAAAPGVKWTSKYAIPDIDANKARALRRLLTIGLTSFGVGTVGAGIAGLRHLRPQIPNVPSEVDVDLPYPQLPEKKADWADAFVSRFIPTARGRVEKPFSWPFLRGDLATKNMTDIPWFLPAATAAATVPAMAGASGTQAIFNKFHKGQMEKELDKAQKDYDAAMLGMYDPERLHKLSSKRPSLDDLCDLAEKVATALPTGTPVTPPPTPPPEPPHFDLNKTTGYQAGLYLTLAGLIAGLTGYGSYNWFRGRSQGKLMEDALKQKALIRSLGSPPDVYMNPVPAHLKNIGSRDRVEADEGTMNEVTNKLKI